MRRSGEVGGEAVAREVRPRTSDPNPTQGFHVSPGTLVAGGGAIVAFGVGTIFGIQSNSTDKRLQAGYNKVTNTYAGTRADALSIQSNALIANVSFGIATAALIVTGVLLFFDIRAGDAPVEVTPAVSPSGGALLIGGHF